MISSDPSGHESRNPIMGVRIVDDRVGLDNSYQ